MTAPYEIVGETSLLVINARSSVGGITWSTSALDGEVDLTVHDGVVDPTTPITATVKVPFGTLRSGNASYDAELHRRIDSRMYPTAEITLDRVVPSPESGRFVLAGMLDFHGVRRAIDGVISVDSASPTRLVVSGEQTIDIRDFGIATPTVLRMRIYPEVKLSLILEATRPAGS